jgi:hypothetical protein
MNVVPVSAMAYALELITVDPTLTLFKLNNQSEKKPLYSLKYYLVI